MRAAFCLCSTKKPLITSKQGFRYFRTSVVSLGPPTNQLNKAEQELSKKLQRLPASEAIQLFKGFNQQKPPHVSLYNQVLTSLKTVRSYERALVLFNEMKSQNVVPDATTYSILLDVHSNLSQFEKAVSLFTEMKNKGFTPSATAYNQVIALYFKLSEYEKAISRFNEMRVLGFAPSFSTYKTVVESYAKLGQSERASSLRQEFQLAAE